MTEMSPEELAGVQLLLDAYKRWDQMGAISLMITRTDAYILLMACQGMVSHPQLPPMLLDGMTHLGRQFQEQVADTPELYALFEAGWNRDFDVARADATEGKST